jgi:hypothetical protein
VKPLRIEIDFRKPQRRLPVMGAIALLLGAGAAYLTYTDYNDTLIDSDLISMSLARYDSSDRDSRAKVAAINPAEITDATRQLSTPWSLLLNDLESVAKDSAKDVALLEIAPDRNKQTVRLSGEARSLQAALDYLGRLQKAESIIYPLLENHEIQTSDRNRPVRFVIVADWRLL